MYQFKRKYLNFIRKLTMDIETDLRNLHHQKETKIQVEMIVKKKLFQAEKNVK